MIRPSLLLVATLLGCSNSTGPFSNLSATNNADDFVFIAQTFGRAATTTLHYTWQHGGNVAQFTLGNTALGGGTLTPISGTASMTIHDAAGTQVYAHGLNGDAADTTAAGMPGNWTIDLAFTNVNGDIVFEVKRAPRDLTVSATTSGTNVDVDGYVATMDGTNSQAIATNGIATFSAVAAGNHTVVLSGVAGNCSVSDGLSRTLSVPAGVPTGIAYSITCT
jgi:hypothetical protein